MAAQVGYLELFRKNVAFRRVWLAQIVSEVGDWLNYAALMQLIHHFTPGAEGAGWLLILQMMMFPLLSPIAGVVADRFDRRKVMIATDLSRMVVVLGFLFVDGPSKLWLLYCLAGVQASLVAFFEPARQALVPSVAKENELVTANSLSSVTWSVTLGIGGFLGGVIADRWGIANAFICDSASFLISASLLMRIPDYRRESSRKPESAGHERGGDFLTAVRYLLAHPPVLAVVLVKSGISIAGSGVWLLAVVYGQKIFPMGNEGALSVGILNGAHGVGALIGAVLTARYMKSPRLSIAWGILLLFTFRAGFFGIWGMAGNIWVVVLATLLITACGSLLWVSSTTILQKMIPADLRGRIFAIEFGLLTLAMAGFLWLIGRALDHWHLSPATVTYGTAVAAGMVALLWLAAILTWPIDSATDRVEASEFSRNPV
jgi:MFS family permease